MTNPKKSIHGEWSSHWAFILAATGAAVGLGNVWKFPYIAGENGGGAFVLVYLLCVIIIGIPLLMAEILIGRRGRQNPAYSLRDLALESGHKPFWQWFGLGIILAGFLILTYYSVIAGWSAAYVFIAATGTFHGASATRITQIFSQLVTNPYKLLFWHTVIMLITVGVIAKGIEKGIENAVRFMFPIMILLLLMLVIYAATTGYFASGLTFLFKPDFRKLTSTGVLSALGHAFFTLSLATGSIMMYGAYLPKKASITKASIYIAIADTSIALIAGIAIFPIVFANGLQPSAGPGLIFQTLPIAFGHLPYGSFFAVLFFVMLLFAALTSAISLLEPTVAWLIETFHTTRARAAIIAGIIIWILGFLTIFSFNILSHVKPFGMTLFDNLDYLTANIMLPIGGLFIAFFAAWLISKNNVRDELQLSDRWLFKSWHFIMRYITPIAIVVIFLNFVGIIKLNSH